MRGPRRVNRREVGQRKLGALHGHRGKQNGQREGKGREREREAKGESMGLRCVHLLGKALHLQGHLRTNMGLMELILH